MAAISRLQGPPFIWDPDDKFFALAVSPWGYDPDYIHCYPVSFPGAAPLDPAPLDSCTTITHVVPYGWQLPFSNVTRGGFSQELLGSPIKTGGACGVIADLSLLGSAFMLAGGPRCVDQPHEPTACHGGRALPCFHVVLIDQNQHPVDLPWPSVACDTGLD